MKSKQAFTLIELLVVVLIIGILAAVALPQYQKAVEKSKATQALTLLKSAYQAMQAYDLANGTKPTNFEELTMEVPWPAVAGTNKRQFSNTEWIMSLYSNVNGDWGIELTRQKGKYKGAGFLMLVESNSSSRSVDQPLCTERTGTTEGNIKPIFDGDEGDYCTKIWKVSSSTNPSGRLRLFPML